MTAPCNEWLACARQAFRIALISACAVGSPSGTTRFFPSPSTRPSRTTTAPNGPPPSPTDSRESSIARRMWASAIFPILCALRDDLNGAALDPKRGAIGRRGLFRGDIDHHVGNL